MADDNKPTYSHQYNDEMIPINVPDKKAATLSKAAKAFIDEWLKRYPEDRKRSGIFEALRFVQEENGGHLTEPLMAGVAEYLGLPHIAAFEVAAFYSMYELQPVGKHIIHVCTNISCSLNGAEKILEHLKQKLGIDLHETTQDGKYTLKEIECLGACVAAPVCLIDKTYHEKLTPEKVDEVLKKI